MASARDTGMLEAMLRSRTCTLVLGLIAMSPAIASAEPAAVPATESADAEASASATPEASASEAGPDAVEAEPSQGAADEPAEPEHEPTEPAPEPTEPSDAAVTTMTGEPTSTSDPAKPVRAGPPRLVIAGGLLVGPHAIGNEECNSSTAECQTKGSFFAVGGNLELRARVWRPLFVHLRGLAVRNVSNNDPIYGGVLGGGVGLGLYHRRIFGRGEYLLLHPFGDNEFEPPFFDGDVANDRWGNHAGTVSVGFRQPLPKRLTVELWGGVMIGPRSVRRIPQVEPDERVLTTFQVGVNLAWDAVP